MPYLYLYLPTGLAIEFMTKELAEGVYGKKGPLGYSDIHQDFHRSR